MKYFVIMAKDTSKWQMDDACNPLFPTKLGTKRLRGSRYVIRMECEKSSLLIGQFASRDTNTRF